VSTGAWHRLGFILNLASVNGWFDVYLDQQQLCFVGGQLTHVHGMIPWGGAGWGGEAGTMKHSHLFLGSGIPEYQARIRRGGVLSDPGLPVEDGAYSGGISTEATHYQALDDAPPDGNASRVDLTAPGQIFSLKRKPLVGTRTILGIQQTAYYKRPATSAYALRQHIAVNGVVYPAPTLAADADDVWAFDQPPFMLVDPSNGLPFTRARVNGDTAITEFGSLAHGSVSA
jgi:hypothetical protein